MLYQILKLSPQEDAQFNFLRFCFQIIFFSVVGSSFIKTDNNISGTEILTYDNLIQNTKMCLLLFNFYIFPVFPTLRSECITIYVMEEP